MRKKKPQPKVHPETAFARFFQSCLQKSNLESLEDFGNTLADLGVVLDPSTFSHWKCGTRLPKNRRILLLVLKVFFIHEGLKTSLDANILLEAAHQGHLTPDEERLVFMTSQKNAKPVKGPIFLTSVHLVMPASLLIKIESLAAEHGISRTTMINSILEERLL